MPRHKKETGSGVHVSRPRPTEGMMTSSVSSASMEENPENFRASARPTAIIARSVGLTLTRRRRDLPWGIRIIQRLSDCCCIVSTPKRDFWYRVSVLGITFLSYTSYHLSRKPISIVKNVLNRNCSLLTPPPELGVNASANWCDWAPFDGSDAETLLGTLDSSFLFAYAAGMFMRYIILHGFVAERVNLRYFLALGMLLSGFFTYLFGVGYTRGIHNIYYYILIQGLAGFVQTTGWPGVVTVVGNWFGKGKRGLIFGLWNSHTSLGNILGSVIAGTFVEENWGLSFIVPGAVVGGMGFFVFLFLVPKPQHVGCTVPDYQPVAPAPSSSTTNGNASRHPNHQNSSSSGIERDGYYPTVGSDSDDDNLSNDLSSDSNYHIRDDTPLISSYLPYDTHDIPVPGDVKIKPVGFKDALKIPGVLEYSLCLFFAKLVSYTFLYWLPRYIGSSTRLTPNQSANLSTLFDFGGIIGGIIAGIISDYSGMSASTCAGMLSVAVPMLLVYQSYGAASLATNMTLLVLVGLLVNGPYALITTAVSTELGTHPCLHGNARALATVTAIIDGTGSIGAAVGPLLAGIVSDFGWKYVFYMLMAADVCAFILLARLVKHEIQRVMEPRPGDLKRKRSDGSYRSLNGKGTHDPGPQSGLETSSLI